MLSGETFYGFELNKFLATQLVTSSLNLFDARRKAAYFAIWIKEVIRSLRAFLAWIMAAHGLGTSRKSASALTYWPSIANPSDTTSRQFEVICGIFRSSKNFFVIYARCWLNSKVYNRPSLPIVSAIAQDSDPEPVPASTTTDPGTRSNLNTIAELSIAYKICVFLAKVSVINVDLGFRAVIVLPGLLKASTSVAHGWLTKLRCR